MAKRVPVTDRTARALALLSELNDAELLRYPIEFEFQPVDEAELEADIDSWLGNRRWAADGTAFRKFGRDGSGSIYLLWGYPGLVAEPPVVFFGVEGGAAMVAPSLADFAHQLVSGQLMVSYGPEQGTWLDPDDGEDDGLDWSELERRVDSVFGPAAASPNEIRAAAESSHPDIDQWFEEQTAG